MKHPRTYKNPYRKMVVTSHGTHCGMFKSVEWTYDRPQRAKPIQPAGILFSKNEKRRVLGYEDADTTTKKPIRSGLSYTVEGVVAIVFLLFVVVFCILIVIKMLTHS